MNSLSANMLNGIARLVYTFVLKEVEEEEKRENQENTAAPEQTQNTAAEETAK